MIPSIILIILLCLATTTNNVMICPTLGSASNFTVIAASAVTNIGPTVINGNLAISPSVTLTGFNSVGTGAINGGTELGTATAVQAQKDVTTAYNYLMSVPLTEQMNSIDLSGKTLQAGVYKFDSAAGIATPAGSLTLNGTGLYIFQVGSALTMNVNSEVRVINGAKASCIFWAVGSSVTIGLNSRFVGNIFAYSAVNLGSNVTYTGSIYAQTAAVTLNTDTITGQTNCDLCQTTPGPIQGRVNRNLPQNSLLYIFIMLLISLF